MIQLNDTRKTTKARRFLYVYVIGTRACVFAVNVNAVGSSAIDIIRSKNKNIRTEQSAHVTHTLGFVVSVGEILI